MRLFVVDGESKKPVGKMTFQQTKQAASVMDCIGRMIPQEGIDYDVEITFKSEYDPKVSMKVIPHTDKGEWWEKYVREMIKKYPPMVGNPEEAIPEYLEREDVVDAEVVS